MSAHEVKSGMLRLSRRIARVFGYRFDHPAEVIVQFPLHALR